MKFLILCFAIGAALGYIAARWVIRLMLPKMKAPCPVRVCQLCGSSVIWNGAIVHYTDCKSGLG